ncbi:VOC family protein [Saccharopolyspora sp. ID03-671]|uniref:VOC family protein n=1 Tax=Saccharopolyspora sp. ID03-671 TaxID=3073066 RepID=UPI00324B4755
MSALTLAAYAIDCADPRRLAEFYGRLLGWRIDEEESGDRWVELADPSGGAPLAFQLDPHHKPSTWPSPEVPQMAHLDVRVGTLDEGHERAIAAGAVQLPQPADQRDARFRVYADPEGHPFCMCASQ